jgi:hypothetical protein
MLIKLTNEKGNTREHEGWKAGETVSIPPKKRSCHFGNCDNWKIEVYFCNPRYFASKKLPLLLWPIGNHSLDFKAFEVKGEIVAHEGGVHDGGVFSLCHEVKVVKELALPAVSMDDRVRFAVLCAKQVVNPIEFPVWTEWANNWIRSKATSLSDARKAKDEAENSKDYTPEALTATLAATSAICALEELCLLSESKKVRVFDRFGFSKEKPTGKWIDLNNEAAQKMKAAFYTAAETIESARKCARVFGKDIDLTVLVVNLWSTLPKNKDFFYDLIKL